LDKLLSVAADIALSEIIAEDEDDVGFARFRAAGESREKQESERGKLHGVRVLKGEWRAESRTESMTDDGGLNGGLNGGLR
jgi:hypothetical protein